MRSILLVTLDEIVLYCKSYFMGWKSLMASGASKTGSLVKAMRPAMFLEKAGSTARFVGSGFGSLARGRVGRPVLQNRGVIQYCNPLHYQYAVHPTLGRRCLLCLH